MRLNLKNKCRICRNDNLQVLINAGSQPLCNRYKIDLISNDYKNELVIVQCRTCALIQLLNTVPDDEIIPKVTWLKYNEPEDHLSNLADILSKLDFSTHSPSALGITYKDDSLLYRLSKKGISKTFRIDPLIDLGIHQEGIAGETIIPKITKNAIQRLISKNGKVDLIIARHIFEHTTNTQEFLKVISRILKPDGYIVFEVPDCIVQLHNFDYTMLWEEHTIYFTSETLRNSFHYTSFDLVSLEEYEYSIENALVAIIQKKDNKLIRKSYDNGLEKNLKIGYLYAEKFLFYKNLLKDVLRNYKMNDEKIAVFGAGHISIMFINLMEVASYIEFIVDDDINKQKVYMPGSGLAIKGSKSLITHGINLCLLSLSPDSERKVLKNNKNFLIKGGLFKSIFPNRKNSIFSA